MLASILDALRDLGYLYRRGMQFKRADGREWEPPEPVRRPGVIDDEPDDAGVDTQLEAPTIGDWRRALGLTERNLHG